jgi:superfamily I DNA/RNA helicase
VWHDAMEKLPQTDMSYILRARQRGERLLSRPRVRVSTIHGAKGGQADHVVVMKEMARRTYADMRREPEDEVRVWYVGVTRAREKVTIVESQVQQACPWL